MLNKQSFYCGNFPERERKEIKEKKKKKKEKKKKERKKGGGEK